MAGAIDEDTKQTLATGRSAIGGLLSAAQTYLQRVFIVFAVGFLVTFYALQAFIWDALKQDLLYEKMDVTTQQATEIVAVTPFDVILLQAKIGLITGALIALPLLLYYAREPLTERGLWPDQRLPQWQLASLSGLAALLFLGGSVYAYQFFFPIMFNFLAANAVQSGFTPTYSIVKWAQFIVFLGLSFGLAAQLPLAMSGLSYAGIVPYETFRDKWRVAILLIFSFGAVFSPPDPFTQTMWAVPLVGLYVFSLGLSKTLVLSKRASDEVPLRDLLVKRWNHAASVGLLAGTGVYLILRRGGVAALNDLLAAAGSTRRVDPLGGLIAGGMDAQTAALVYAVPLGLLAAGFALFYFRIKALEAVAAGPVAAEGTSPADIDLGALDVGGVQAAPPEAFEALSESEALGLANEAMEADNPEKAQAILDRWDTHQEGAEDDGEAVEATDAAGEAASAEAAPAGAGGNVVSSTAAGMLDPFTEDETTEDDIGGYYHDIAFILDSLTSKAIYLVAAFMAVMAGTFFYLYSGGIRDIKRVFVRRLPETMQDQVDIVTLHPVEALVFEVKFSVLLGIVALLPFVLYWMWPALKERGFAVGDRNVLLVWGGTIVVALLGGSFLGFFYIAPAAISWLAFDSLSSNMIIAYRINSFGWLIIFTTIGIGILAEIPVSMLLFHYGGIVSYDTIRRRWKVIVLGCFVFGAMASPSGLFTMFLLSLPAAFAVLVGMGALWVVTLGGRRVPARESEPAD
jgi:sec-independent protein translocase protein TatC